MSRFQILSQLFSAPDISLINKKDNNDPVWLNGWVFIYKPSGCGFKSCCCHLNFRYGTCFVRARSSLTFRQTIECRFTMKLIHNMTITYSHQNDHFIGFLTKQKLQKLFEEDVLKFQKDKFLANVHSFYNTACNYSVKWLPLNKPLLRHC